MNMKDVKKRIVSCGQGWENK